MTQQMMLEKFSYLGWEWWTKGLLRFFLILIDSKIKYK